ncbi:alpha/beta fold hydrolase [Streptomyces flaveolus]|uniref:alpha/beta fold hydrolase n=1 Tax=Streptomyces flaveolus TaxID=67297 RepID=UPI0038256435
MNYEVKMNHDLGRSLVVDGTTIKWDVAGAGPDLVLVHGNGANHAWWGPLEGLLAGRYRLTLLDLSGHGDSDHRDQYEPRFWVNEVRAVMAASEVTDPFLVGHSMGGRVVLSLAAEHPDELAGLMLFDTSIRPADRYRDFQRREHRPPPVYPTKEAAAARFRLKPEQPHPGPEVMAPLAEKALKRTAEGWTWKYDHRALMRFTDAGVDAAARLVTAPMAYVWASGSVVVDDDLADYVMKVVQGPVTPARVEDAYHHVILDQPKVCARLIDEFVYSLRGTAERDAV